MARERQGRKRKERIVESFYYVGLDVHKDSISVALLDPERGLVEWTCGGDTAAVDRLGRRLAKLAGAVSCGYEAGPGGYHVQRRLAALGVACQVVAPSLIPVKPGQRVKTDRRDARKLAELLRAGLLTEVQPPTPEEEAVRDLCRCREDAVQDLTRSRHRLTKWLLRRGLRCEGRHWTGKHRQWLRRLRFDHLAEEAAFTDYLLAVEVLEERVKSLGQKLEAAAQTAPYREAVAWLRCFKGIDTVIAMTIVTELHGFERFTSPRQLMAYLGLTPSEYSSGGQERRGGITKAGNSHVRRVLIEAAWQYQRRPGRGLALRHRREGQPGWVLAIAEKAQLRLHQRYHRLTGRGKPPNKAVTAVARELVGFIWSVLAQPSA